MGRHRNVVKGSWEGLVGLPNAPKAKCCSRDAVNLRSCRVSIVAFISTIPFFLLPSSGARALHAASTDAA